MKHIEIINQHGHAYCDVCGLGTEHPDFDNGECPGDPRDAELTTLRAQVAGLEDRYNELLFAVGNKYEGETRHQTALRYIRERESAASDAASAVKEPA